jgi:peptide-methionine (S)-S-oxide reductase
MKMTSPGDHSVRFRPHHAFQNAALNLFVIVTSIFVMEVTYIMADPKQGPAKTSESTNTESPSAVAALEEATFGSGCFWCTEAVFQQLKGVKAVVSGYSGGRTKNPTYEEVCTGATGHAEVIRVKFDPKVVTYVDLLEVFWKTHDPTTLNRQGADHGTQYRSVIFYHNETQQKLATEYKKKLDESKAFDKPIVTEISPIKDFYPGEDYHQNYFRNHPENPYCTAVINRKVAKFKAVFKDKLKKNGEF